MTSQKAKDIIELSREEPNPFAVIYNSLINNICAGLCSVDKDVTEESLRIVLSGFSISIILNYIHYHDLESETDTLLTDDLVNDVSGYIWESWLEPQMEEAIETFKGDNVVPLKAVN